MAKEGRNEQMALQEGEPKRTFELKSLDEAKAYHEWKQTVPLHLRQIVEGAILGKEPPALKDCTPLFGQFISSVQKLISDPNIDTASLVIDTRVKNQLLKLKKVSLDEQNFVDVFEILRNPEIGFQQKLSWYKAQIEPRLKWLQVQDFAKIEPSETTIIPEDSQDELTPSMDELEESKEELKEGFYEVAPFYGGYYKGHNYEIWDHINLKWKKDQRELSETGNAPEFVEGTVRNMRGKFRAGKFQPVDLPYGFGIDPQSFKLSEGANAKIFRDNDGILYCKSEHEKISETEIEFKIGKLKSPEAGADIAKEYQILSSNLPQEVMQKINDAKGSNLPAVSKARILCRYVKNGLEYSNDSSCNNLYRSQADQYFNKIWQNKKADCDVSNTFAAEVLRQSGIKVRMIAGHYVKSASKSGSAILHGGTGHAWLEVFDDEKWIRMDATPKGDPVLDEEEQEKDLTDTNEGDYGEREAEIMSDEELQKLIEELDKTEKEAITESPEIKFAKEAGCTPQEARMVLQKIANLRQLKDLKGRNLLKESKNVWRDVIKKNLKERIVYTGPVRMHEGEDLTDVVDARIDIKSGEKNPSGYEKRTKRVEMQKYFGGFEVYIAADLSGSMDEIDPQSGQKKSEAQRDCVFLFADSIMSNALEARRNQSKLKSPMPVKICVTVFGAKTEVVLPLTGEWGPAEQIRLYKALDQIVRGGTPDDEALKMINEQILHSKNQEEIGKKGKKQVGGMHRFAAVFADGGSNNASAVRNIVQNMRDDGIVVYGFGVTASGSAMEVVYAPDGSTVEDSSKLAEVGLKMLVKTVKKWYDI
jgi:hypothetical protein